MLEKNKVASFSGGLHGNAGFPIEVTLTSCTMTCEDSDNYCELADLIRWSQVESESKVKQHFHSVPEETRTDTSYRHYLTLKASTGV